MSKFLEITTKIGCDINCKYCPQKLLISRYFSENIDRPVFMSFETFKTCIDKVPTDVKITFAGMSEPWLNPECTKMVSYASEKGHKLAIFTTLVGMTTQDLEVLENLSIEQLVWHIPDKQGNSRIKVTEDYCALLETAVNKKIGINESFSCHGPVHESIKSIIPENAVVSGENELIDRAGNLEEVRHQNIRERCLCMLDGQKLMSNILLPDGTVLLCCMDYGMQHVLGNLLENSYEELAASPTAELVRNGMNEPGADILCRKCPNARTYSQLAQLYFDEKEISSSLWITRWWQEKKISEYQMELCELRQWTNELESGKAYLENQVIQKDSRIEELERWNKELEQAKDYLAEQEVRQSDRIAELEVWCQKLEQAKAYLKSKWEEEQVFADGMEQTNTQLENKIAELENELAKFRYKLNLLLSDSKVRKIIDKKKYEI